MSRKWCIDLLKTKGLHGDVGPRFEVNGSRFMDALREALSATKTAKARRCAGPALCFFYYLYSTKLSITALPTLFFGGSVG
jgi:hypothetical protein